MILRALVAGLVVCVALSGQDVARPAVFTAAQAAEGRTAYQSTCINCHGETLIPQAGAQYMGQDIPPLAGASFLSRWGARKTDELADRIRVAISGFPPKGSGEKTHLDLAAYVLQVNGAQSGAQELTAATSVLIQTTTGSKESK